jgi:hypothetical protein
MSLESLYNSAASNTYVGTVRTRQADLAPTNQTLVNFLDGERRSQGNNELDAFQIEFTRNAPNSYVAGGAQPPILANNTTRNSDAGAKTNTRWTNNAFKVAFDNKGPVSLINGFYTNQFRPEFNGERVHKYTPKLNSKFGDVNTSAKTRIVSSPSGAPTGF